MKGTFFKGVLLGAICSTLVLIASSALAGTGVGAIFNLGVFNSVSGATTDLSTNHSGPGLRVDNAGTGNAIVGRLTNLTPAVHTAGIQGNNLATNGFGFGVWGAHQSGGVGVLGSTVSGIGVRGTHQAAFGNQAGVEGFTVSAVGPGGRFENETAGAGTAGVGLIALGREHNDADNGIGPDGFDGGIEASGPNGIEGNSHQAGGFGVSGDGPAVGVNGTATAAGGIGGNFSGNATGIGVQGTSANIGVRANGGLTGLLADGTDFGVDSDVTATGAIGIRSTAGASSNDGIQASTAGGISDGVQATVAGGGAFALFGIATGGGVGLVASGGTGTGVSSSNNSATNNSLNASNSAAGGTAGNFTGDTALNVNLNDISGIGLDATVTGNTDGANAVDDDANQAINAATDDTNSPNTVQASNGGVPSDSLTAEAIEAFGFVDINGSARVTGNLDVVGVCCGPLIDNPVDPANSYLRHASVSAPEMKNMYDGIVTTDGSGTANVQLPDYFGAFNKDFRYQLTVIGDFGQAIISKEISERSNMFQIKTENPNAKVSWQVTGVRNDAYAQAHPFQAVEDKPAALKGQYLTPELFGQPSAVPLGLDLRSPTSDMLAAAEKQAASERYMQELIAKKVAQAKKDAQVRGTKASAPVRQRTR